MTTRIRVERLEDRTTPSVYLDVNNILYASVDRTGGTHAVVADSGANPGDVTITVDGQAQSFSGVVGLDLRGAVRGNNFVENNTSLTATLTGVGKADTLFGGTGSDTLNAGNGDEILYDLLGSNVINSKNGRSDQVFTNAQSVSNVDKKDSVTVFFADNRLPGAGSVVLEDGVLYLTPSDNGTMTFLNPVKGGYLLSYDWGNGLQTQFFTKKQVDSVAYFGGAGNDTFINNTNLSQAAYGGIGTGNDVLIGGFGKLDILKGLGGSDILVGRADQNDLSNSGSSVSDGSVDYLFSFGRTNVFRAGAEDLTFSLFGKDVFVR